MTKGRLWRGGGGGRVGRHREVKDVLGLQAEVAVTTLAGVVRLYQSKGLKAR